MPGIRPFTYADVGSVAALHEAVWWPHRSEAGWRWLANTPRRPKDAPLGWVYETEAGIKGFIGNFLQPYVYRGEAFTGATGFSLIVDPSIKGKSLELIPLQGDQPGLAANFTLNANWRSAPIFPRFGFEPWPDGFSNVKYSWSLAPAAMAVERGVRALQRRLAPDWIPRADHFLSSRLGDASIEECEKGVTPIAIAQSKPALDRFWAALSAEDRVLALRDADALAWRCADPELTLPPIVLAYWDGAEIVGLLIAFYGKNSELELPALEIVDLIGLADYEAAAVPALVKTLLANARRLGVARVRLTATNARLEAALRPPDWVRRTYGHNHGHLRINKGAPEGLKAAWAPTPFDGDFSVNLRAPPAQARAGRLKAMAV